MPRKKKDVWTKQTFIEDARTRLLELMGLVRRHIDSNGGGEGGKSARGRGRGGRISRTAAEGHLRDVLSIMGEARHHTDIQQVCEKLTRQMISIILESEADEENKAQQIKTKIIKKTVNTTKSKVKISDRQSQHTYNSNINLSNLTEHFILVRGKENIQEKKLRRRKKQEIKLNTKTTDKEKMSDASRPSFFLDTQSNEMADCSRAYNYTENTILTNDNNLFSNLDDTVVDPDYIYTKEVNTDSSTQRSDIEMHLPGTSFTPQEINKQQAFLNENDDESVFCIEKADAVNDPINNESDNRTEKFPSSGNLGSLYSNSKVTVDFDSHNKPSDPQEMIHLSTATTNSEDKFFKDIKTKHIGRKNIIRPYHTPSYLVTEQTPIPTSGSKVTCAENYLIDMDIDFTVCDRLNLINTGITDVTTKKYFLSNDTHKKSVQNNPGLSSDVSYSESNDSQFCTLRDSSINNQLVTNYQANQKSCLQNDLGVKNKKNMSETRVINGKKTNANMYEFKKYNNNSKATNHFKDCKLPKQPTVRNVSITNTPQDTIVTGKVLISPAYGNENHIIENSSLNMNTQIIEKGISKININSDRQQIQTKACKITSKPKKMKTKTMNSTKSKKTKAEKKAKQTPKSKKGTQVSDWERLTYVRSFEWLDKIKFVRIPDEDEYIPITQENFNIWDPDYCIPDADFRI